MALSDLWADNLVNLLLQLPTAPAGLPVMHLELYVVLPLPDGTGGVTPDPLLGYVGPVDVHGTAFWSDSSGGEGESVLGDDVDFGTPTADWGPVVGCAFVEADGTLVTVAEEFDTPYDVEVGVPFTLPASAVALNVATAS